MNGFISNVPAINFPYSSCRTFCGGASEFFHCKKKYAEAKRAADKKFKNTKRTADIF